MRSPPKSPKRKRSSAAVPVVADAAVVAAPAASAVAAPTIALASNCSVKDAVALKESLCAVADADASVVLDASGVERVDTATVQLLCAFVRERVASNKGIVWQGVPAAMQEAARLLGVHALLALPQDSAGVAA